MESLLRATEQKKRQNEFGACRLLNCNLLLGKSLKAGGNFVAFVAKRQERLDKAPLFDFFPGCVSVSSLVALEIDGEFELFEGFFEFAAVVGVRHVGLRCFVWVSSCSLCVPEAASRCGNDLLYIIRYVGRIASAHCCMTGRRCSRRSERW